MPTTPQGQLVTVSTASVLLAAGPAADSRVAGQDDYRTRSVVLINHTGTAVVWIDKVPITSAPAVGGSDGNSPVPWDASVLGPLSFDLEPGEEIYARLPTGGADQAVYVLPQGR